MSSSQDISPIFQKACNLIETHEPVFADSWKRVGKDACMSEVLRKSAFIRVQWQKGRLNEEDLLDLINLAGFAYWHMINEKEKRGANA